MTANEYLLNIINQNKNVVLTDATANYVFGTLFTIIRTWGNVYCENIYFSGSNAKGTAIKGSSDIDFLISLSSKMPGTLSEIYFSLEKYLNDSNYSTRR